VPPAFLFSPQKHLCQVRCVGCEPRRDLFFIALRLRCARAYGVRKWILSLLTQPLSLSARCAPRERTGLGRAKALSSAPFGGSDMEEFQDVVGSGLCFLQTTLSRSYVAHKSAVRESPCGLPSLRHASCCVSLRPYPSIRKKLLPASSR